MLDKVLLVAVFAQALLGVEFYPPVIFPSLTQTLARFAIYVMRTAGLVVIAVMMTISVAVAMCVTIVTVALIVRTSSVGPFFVNLAGRYLMGNLFAFVVFHIVCNRTRNTERHDTN
ncbi:MAG: hypothetical protein QNK92_02485 [Amylibacter sp.]